MSQFKNHKVNFILQYRISEEINQIFTILDLFSKQQNFYTTQVFTKQDWYCAKVFSNKNFRTNEGENSWKFKNSKFQSNMYRLLKKV